MHPDKAPNQKIGPDETHGRATDVHNKHRRGTPHQRLLLAATLVHGFPTLLNLIAATPGSAPPLRNLRSPRHLP